MMERKCEECSSWAQDIYWNHFESMHFIQLLEGDFHNQLMIPRKFSENARGKLQETVTLKGPSGTATWEIRLMGCGDDLFFKDGWRDFANAFSLEENDILLFKCRTNSCLDVLIFDRSTLCEKESSYFIRRCGHLRPDNASNEQKSLKETPDDDADDDPEEYSSEDVDAIPTKKFKKDRDHEEEAASQQKNHHVNFSAQKATPKKKEPYFNWVPVNLPPGLVSDQRKKLRKREPDVDIEKYISGSSTVTEQRMKKVLQMAKKELTDDGFLVVMRPTHVSRKFYLSIPAEWLATHLNYKKQNVQLRTNGCIWLTKIIFSSKGRGGLGFGWKKFALDNGLEELDVLVFNPAYQKDEPVLLNVIIFRVAAEPV